jgi:dTDP-D-glucose 4,6-dehydratase
VRPGSGWSLRESSLPEDGQVPINADLMTLVSDSPGHHNKCALESQKFHDQSGWAVVTCLTERLETTAARFLCRFVGREAVVIAEEDT